MYLEEAQEVEKALEVGATHSKGFLRNSETLLEGRGWAGKSMGNAAWGHKPGLMVTRVKSRPY